jgi:YfiH family protein
VTDLRHLILEDARVDHAFGTRDSQSPPRIIRPRQVHGVAVAIAVAGEPSPSDADAIVSADSDCPVGIVTADCVPILVAASDGSAVAAIHAGWRGLAAGVVVAGMDCLRERSTRDIPFVAAIGPYIGPCCYEVDDPVIRPLRQRFGSDLDASLHDLAPAHPGHSMLDLGALVLIDLERAGIEPASRGRLLNACTHCNPARFHSYRRDAQAAGRLLHWIRAGIGAGHPQGPS